MYSQFYMRHADPKKIQDFSDYFYAETENNTEFKVNNLFLEEIKSSLIQYEWELGIFYGETYSDKKLTKTAYKIIVFIDDFLENYNNPDNENSIDINIYHALLYVKQILESSLNKSWGYKFFHARSHLSDIKYKNILDNILSVLPDDIEKTIFNLIKVMGLFQ